MQRNDPVMHRVVVDGSEVECVDHGTGEPLLLVHAGVFSAWFAPLADSPSLDGFRVLRVRRAGYDDAPPAGHVTLADHARHVAVLAEQLGLSRLHWVGHSSSCLIGLQLAVERPELIHSLILLEPAPGGALRFQPSGATSWRRRAPDAGYADGVRRIYARRRWRRLPGRRRSAVGSGRGRAGHARVGVLFRRRGPRRVGMAVQRGRRAAGAAANAAGRRRRKLSPRADEPPDHRADDGAVSARGVCAHGWGEPPAATASARRRGRADRRLRAPPSDRGGIRASSAAAYDAPGSLRRAY